MPRIKMVSQVLSSRISHPVHGLPGQVFIPRIWRTNCIQRVVLLPLSPSVFPQGRPSYPSTSASIPLSQRQGVPLTVCSSESWMSYNTRIPESFRSCPICYSSASGTKLFASYPLNPFLAHHFFSKLHSLIYHSLSPSSQFLLCILPNLWVTYNSSQL